MDTIREIYNILKNYNSDIPNEIFNSKEFYGIFSQTNTDFKDTKENSVMSYMELLNIIILNNHGYVYSLNDDYVLDICVWHSGYLEVRLNKLENDYNELYARIGRLELSKSPTHSPSRLRTVINITNE